MVEYSDNHITQNPFIYLSAVGRINNRGLGELAPPSNTIQSKLTKIEVIYTRLKEETREKDYFGDERAIVRAYTTKQRVSEFAYFAYFIEIVSSLKNIKFVRVRILNESYRVGSDGHMYFSDEEVNDKQLATSKYWKFKQNALNELAGFWCDGTMNGKEVAIEILPKKQEVIIATPEQNPANISLLETEMSIEGMFEQA